MAHAQSPLNPFSLAGRIAVVTGGYGELGGSIATGLAAFPQHTDLMLENAVLYEDSEVVREHERFFSRAIEAAYAGAPAIGCRS